MDPVTIFWIVYGITMFIIAAAAVIMASRKGKTSDSTADDFEATTADEGATIPVVFGTCWLGQNVVWYGKVETSAVKSSSGKK